MGSCSIGSLCSLDHQKRWKAAGSLEAGCWAREGAVVRVVRKGRQVRPANVFEADAVPLYLLSTLSPDTVLPDDLFVQLSTLRLPELSNPASELPAAFHRF